MRDSSRDFFPGKYDPFYIPKKEERKKENEKGREKREKEPQRYQKSFTTDRAKILKSIKIIECKTTISFFFFFLRRFNSSMVFLSAICLKKGEKDKRYFEKYAWKRV